MAGPETSHARDSNFSGPEKTFNHAVILSAAYCDAEIRAEFGALPPSFLPFDAERLFKSQVNVLSKVSSVIYMTLPASFKVPSADQSWLDERGVAILKIPEPLSLGESLAYALDTVGDIGSLCILHGDTFLPDLGERKPDSVGVWDRPPEYEWGTPPRGEIEKALVGFFAFRSASFYRHSLRMSEMDFLSSLELYSRSFKLDYFEARNWFDLGHLQGLYKARRGQDLSRAFNSIQFDGRKVTKTSYNPEKLLSEVNWFESIPSPLRIFTPHIVESSQKGYSSEYDPSPTLSELYIFGNLPQRKWQKIAQAVFEFLETCAQYTDESKSDPALSLAGLGKHALNRLETWATESKIDLYENWEINGMSTPGLVEIVNRTSESILSMSENMSAVIHGDFCFPNILYDFRREMIRVIDPRGQSFAGEDTIFGDFRYDLAKLRHSLEGYDQIIYGRFSILRPTAYSLSLEMPLMEVTSGCWRGFESHTVGGLSIATPEIRSIVILLFLAMLPLHSDRPDRQLAFLARALELWIESESSE